MQASKLTIDEHSLCIGDKRVQLVSGAFHYFRVPRQQWQDRLYKCRQGGLNCIETVVPWNVHEFREDVFDWSDHRDLPAFLDLCHEMGFMIIVRPSPYICAEWDNGGFPSWLSQKTGMAYRRGNAVYLTFVARWYDELIPHLASRQWGHGGSIILVQIENEYGYYQDAQDISYMEFLRDALLERGIEVPLLTCDWPGRGFLVEGAVKGANFGSDFRDGLSTLRAEQPGAFAFVTELWLAWFDHWGGQHHSRPARDVANALKEVLSAGGQFNFYMWAGGTNFGYNAGRTTTGPYGAFITTSYDYDAPISETGALTEKYYECRLVNWLATSLPELFAGSREVPLRWTATNGDVSAVMRMSPLGETTYLRNDTDQLQCFRLQTEEGLWPVDHDLVLQPSDTRILVSHCRLDERMWLETCSCEVLAWVSSEAGAVRPALLLYDEAAQEFTVEVTVDGVRHLLRDRIPADGETTVLDLAGVDVVMMSRRTAGMACILRDGERVVWRVQPDYGRLEGRETSHAVPWNWATVDSLRTLVDMRPSQHSEGPSVSRMHWTVPSLLSLDSLGVQQGYGWYSTTFEHGGGLTQLVLTEVHDRAIVFVNGVHQGVIGSFSTYACLSIATLPGENRLDILVDALGRYTFTSRVGEVKGLLGAAYIGGCVARLEGPLAVDKSTTLTAESDLGEAGPVRRDDVHRHVFRIPWEPGQGLLIRVAGKGRQPLRIGLDETLLHVHRSIGDDDEFVELNLTPYLRPEGNRLWVDGLAESEFSLTLSAVRFDIAGQISGSWRVYPGVIGEDCAVDIDFAVFEDLPWKVLGGLGREQQGVVASQGTREAERKPTLFRTEFDFGVWRPESTDRDLDSDSDHLGVTAWKLVTDGLSKGVVWLNGHHLGRYWNVGPQQALYVPEQWLQAANVMVIFDEQGCNPADVKLVVCESFR
ncbi:MAG: beta-galactosidase [Firmicutes bacterium]|nr:beta-galactosidase [Bacillota bacterium]